MMSARSSTAAGNAFNWGNMHNRAHQACIFQDFSLLSPVFFNLDLALPNGYRLLRALRKSKNKSADAPPHTDSNTRNGTPL